MDKTTRKQFRRQRLIDLIEKHFDGSQAALANAAQIAPTMVWRYINTPHGIGEAMRDKIETNTGFRGWFDEQGDYNNQPQTKTHQTSEAPPSAYSQKSRMIALAPPAVTLDLDADCLLVWQQLQQLPADIREEWRARLEIAAGEARLAKLRCGKPSQQATPPDKAPSPSPKARDPA